MFLHGWGVNSGIWRDYTEQLLSEVPDIAVHLIDLPGYGTQVSAECDGDIVAMARSCLERAPENAIWVGWSLGGMVALQAALLDESAQISALQLICTSPKFVSDGEWAAGVDLEVFQRFADELKADYRRTLSVFLLMQSGKNFGARELAQRAHEAICEYDAPSVLTLQSGIDCLRDADLRGAIPQISVPCQVIAGSLDRVANPEGSAEMARLLNAQFEVLDAGHAPFLTQPDKTLALMKGLIASVGRND